MLVLMCAQYKDYMAPSCYTFIWRFRGTPRGQEVILFYLMIKAMRTYINIYVTAEIVKSLEQ